MGVPNGRGWERRPKKSGVKWDAQEALRYVLWPICKASCSRVEDVLELSCLILHGLQQYTSNPPNGPVSKACDFCVATLQYKQG